MPINSTDIQVEQPRGLAYILNHHPLKMPSHQRDYAWTEDQISRFYSDLSTAIDAANQKNYFFGSIVTIPRYEDGDLDHMEIIDGQQRLATTSIFLAAVRDYLHSIGEEQMATSIDADYMVRFSYSQEAKIPRLSMNVADNEFFRSFVVGGNHDVEPSIPSNTRIKNSYELASKKIKSIVDGLPVNMHKKTLSKWISYLNDKAIVVMFMASDSADAYKMFETLNDRGLSTTQADLVKNYIFGISNDGLEQRKAMWSHIKSSLEEIDNDDYDLTIVFLRHALTCIHGARVINDRIYEYTTKSVTNSDTAFKFLSYLEQASHSYAAISNPEHSDWADFPSSIRRSIETLNLLDIAPMQPLLLATAMHFEKEEIIKTFKFLISLGVRLFIATSHRSGAIYDAMSGAAQLVFNSEATTANDIKQAVKKITPSDDAFLEKFAIADSSRPKLSRYYLKTLEREMMRMPEPSLIPNDSAQELTLEYILPMQPDEKFSNFSEADVYMYRKRIGNMALLQARQNSDSKNNAFIDKKAIYAESALHLTAEVANYDDWNVDAILSRQQNLADLAVKAWPI